MTLTATVPLIEALEAALPQTQCGQCGYEGCTPYAQALAAGGAECDRCPPGGDIVAAALAILLGVPARVYDRTRGEQLPPQIAVIREAECIGCTKCIQACPVDAIVGAAERMHTVMLDACSGCALCVPVCPVDCIDLVATAGLASGSAADAVTTAHAQRHPHADAWRSRHDARLHRLEANRLERDARLAAQSVKAAAGGATLPAAVAAALERARENRGYVAISASTENEARPGSEAMKWQPDPGFSGGRNT